MTELSTQHKTRVVIVGGGFGGLSTAKGLADAPFNVTLIDRNNHHLFQPLLYQVATAGLSPADIARRFAASFADSKTSRSCLREVSGVESPAKRSSPRAAVPYDTLVLATGARHAYFGHDDWAEFAPGLKTIDDATYIRRRILLAFEKAETEDDAAERQRLMTFVVVGGGRPASKWPARSRSSPIARSRPTSARSIRVARGSFWSRPRQRVLTPFDPSLSACGPAIAPEQLGVEVRLGAAVSECNADAVCAGR